MKKAIVLLASAAVLGTGVAYAPATAQTAGLSAEAQTLNARRSEAAAIRKWHDIMLDTHSADFAPGGTPQIGGPTRTSRAFAMVMVSVFDAVNAFEKKTQGYNDIPAALPGASKKVAIAYAAHNVMVALWTNQAGTLDQILQDDLAEIGATGQALARGRAVGEAAAAAMLARRANDGSQIGEVNWGQGGRIATGTTNFYGQPVNGGATGPLQWTPDPEGTNQIAFGASWGAVTPFALTSGAQFRAAPFDQPGTAAYRWNFDDVKALGASPDTPGSTGTARTQFIGNYWGYDGPPTLGVPPRLYAQIADVLAEKARITKPEELAKFYALLHVSMADSGIGAWDTKYYYNFWRPVTGLREDDGDPATTAVPGWKPFGISLANVQTATPRRLTPPFPAYTSGHATFGAALFETARGFMPDNTAFTFVSDEYNGVTTDPFTPGVVRPLVPVRYRTLSSAEDENGRSRVFNGVHWQFDADSGIRMGRQIARYARATLFRRR